MSEALAVNEGDREFEWIELLIATLVLGSVVGALVYFAATGQRYQVGDAATFQNPLTWIGAAGRVFFAFMARLPLARAGWRLGVAVGILTLLTPLGNPGLVAWVARAGATMIWTMVVAIATGRVVTNRWRTVAIVAFFAEVGLRYWSLQNWDYVTGRSTVLWGE